MEPLHFKTQVLPSGDVEPHILHVEDDPGYAAMVAQVLEANGYRVTSAEDGISGLIAFNQNPNQWAAVLVDLNLPHISGSSLIDEMHRIRPELPLVVLTGELPDANLKLYEQGAAIMWHKPISPSNLLEYLKVLINPHP